MADGMHVTIAAENEAIIDTGSYIGPGGTTVDLKESVAKACAGTRSYSPQDSARLLAAARAEPDPTRGPATASPAPSPSPSPSPSPEVTDESSMLAAGRLVAAGAERVAVLNFASARNPGGGYLGGARAQEEDLCRVSALYTTLLHAPDYYEAHRASRDPFYSHRVIYSPDVPVYRDEHYALVDRPYTVSFLTSPAPNAGIIARDLPDRIGAASPELAERVARVLAVAVHHDHRVLVLGAWGCGVFRNDPVQVAAAFRSHLTGDGDFAGRFDRVVFAVLDRVKGQPNLAAFRAAFPSGDAVGT